MSLLLVLQLLQAQKTISSRADNGSIQKKKCHLTVAVSSCVEMVVLFQSTSPHLLSFSLIKKTNELLSAAALGILKVWTPEILIFKGGGIIWNNV